MKKIKVFIGITVLGIAGFLMVAADHIDAPAVTGGTSDITDFYAFQGEDEDNLVFVANVQGLLSPSATENASFDRRVMVEFNIDNNGDNVEDLVIQAIPFGSVMLFSGPFDASGNNIFNRPISFVRITPYGSQPIIRNSSQGISYFAGPRDDPFFFDFGQFTEIISGNATSFNNPGTDTFAGTNVLSVVVEVPKTLLGNSDTVNTWVETKRR